MFISLGLGSFILAGAIASWVSQVSANASNLEFPVSAVPFTAPQSTTPQSVAMAPERPALSSEWRLATDAEEEAQWDYILNSPIGVAALNQLAIEGFISPVCPKTFYINDQYGGFQALMQVTCPDFRGVSSAISYDEMRVIFNRFESTIENFEIQRIGQS